MRKLRMALILTTLLSMQSIFADTAPDLSEDSSADKPCASIVTACLSAGYVRTETPNKRLWQDCMWPIILGKTVVGVKVDTNTVQACRTDKVNQLKMEMKDLQKVMSKP